MGEKADLWARRWLATMFLVMIAAAFWQRFLSPESAMGNLDPSGARTYVGHLTVARGSVKIPTIRRGERGDVFVERSTAKPEATGRSGYSWRILPLPMGPVTASDDAPHGWSVTRIPDCDRAEDSFYGFVTVPETATERDYLISITLYPVD